MGVNGEALQLHAVYKAILQVMQESILVSGTSSHMYCVWMCNEIKGSYDKIIITIRSTKNITVCCWHYYSRLSVLLRVCSFTRAALRKLFMLFRYIMCVLMWYCSAATVVKCLATSSIPVTKFHICTLLTRCLWSSFTPTLHT